MTEEVYTDVYGSTAQPNLNQGVFTTVLVKTHQPCLWQYHHQRLLQAAQAFNYAYDAEVCSQYVHRLAERSLGNVIKIVLNSGGMYFTTRTQYYDLSLYHTGVSVKLSEVSLEKQTYPTHKFLNRTLYTRARQSLNGSVFETLLSYHNAGKQYIQEGSVTNLLLFKKNKVITPDYGYAGVLGTMLQYLMDNFDIEMRKIHLNEIYSSDAIMLNNALIGGLPVCKVDDFSVEMTHPLMKKIMEVVNAPC